MHAQLRDADVASAELVEEKRLSRELSAQVQDFTEGACADDAFHALPGWPEAIQQSLPSVHLATKLSRDARHSRLSKQNFESGERIVQAPPQAVQKQHRAQMRFL